MLQHPNLNDIAALRSKHTGRPSADPVYAPPDMDNLPDERTWLVRRNFMINDLHKRLRVMVREEQRCAVLDVWLAHL